MQASLYYQLSQIEADHWWFQGRRLLVRQVLNSFPIEKGGEALDLGCGTGGNFSLLSEFCDRVTGIELSQTAIEEAQRKNPGIAIVRGDINCLETFFDRDKFRLATVFNVLYHRWIKEESQVLEQIYNLLEPQGQLILTEPAFPCLWRSHDRLDFGKRRYHLREIKSYLKNAGYELLYASYFNCISFMPAFALALREKLIRVSEEDKEQVEELKLTTGPLQFLMKWGLFLERQYLALFPLPLGVSLICVARKQ